MSMPDDLFYEKPSLAAGATVVKTPGADHVEPLSSLTSTAVSSSAASPEPPRDSSTQPTRGRGRGRGRPFRGRGRGGYRGRPRAFETEL